MVKLEGLQKKIKIDDVELCYYEDGKGDTIIMLHGNGMESKYFSKMFKKLSKRYRVIAIDTRAHGHSSRGKKEFSIELFADDVIEFCKCKKIKKTTIIGYSDGANIALWVAKKDEELLEKLVLISGNYKEEGLYGWFILFLEFYTLILDIGSKCVKKLKNKYELAKIMLGDIGIEEEDLREINVSTLVLCADIEVVHIEHTKDINKNIKNSTLKVIKGTSHIDIGKRTRTIKEIYKFLNSN